MDKQLLISIINLVSFYILMPHTSGDFTIGLQVDYFNSMNATGYPIPLKSNIKIEQFTMPNTLNFGDLEKIQISKFDFIIYDYNLYLIVLTNQYKIPYLIISEITNSPPLPSNVFYMSSIDQQTSDCTKSLLSYLKASNVVVFIDASQKSQFGSFASVTDIPKTLIMVNETTSFSSVFVNQFPNDENSFYVSAIQPNQTNLINSLLNEAMKFGQLNPRKTWIFIDKDSDFKNFQSYASVGGIIYGYKMNWGKDIIISNQSTFSQYAVKDYIRLIYNAFGTLNSKPANMSAQLSSVILTDGFLSSYAGFDPNTNKYNGTAIWVKQINTLLNPPDKFVFTTVLKQVTSNQNVGNVADSSLAVKIGVMFSKAYFMQKPTGEYYGLSVAILDELRKLSKFNYVYVFPNISINPNFSTYGHLNSLITNNLADIVLIPMVNLYVTKEAYLSDQLFSMSLNMLTRSPDIRTYPITLLPFDTNVWFGIILIIILMTFGCWTLSALNPQTITKGGTKKKKIYSFGFSLLIIYSSFVMAKLKVKILQFSTQIFVFILWFSTLTIVITYTSNLLPYLVKSNHIYPFSSASQLVNISNDIYQWVFVKNSVDIDMAQNDKDLSILYSKAQQQWPNTMFVDDLTSESILSVSGRILIQNSHKNRYIYNTLNCSSEIITGIPQRFPTVFPINNNWPKKEQMKIMISQLIAKGIMANYFISYINTGPCSRTFTTGNISPLTLTIDKLFLLFSIPLGGCFFGITFVVCSILLNKCRRSLKNMNREKFITGQKYEAKVHSLENNGVWAFINKRDRPYFVAASSLHPDLRKRYTPAEINIKVGDILTLKYFGKDPISDNKRFCRDIDDITC